MIIILTGRSQSSGTCSTIQSRVLPCLYILKNLYVWLYEVAIIETLFTWTSFYYTCNYIH